MKAVTKKLTVLSTEPVDKMKLARRTFTLEFKADVVRHRKAENLSWTDAGKAFDVLPKLVKDWEALYDKGLLTGEAGRRTVSPEQAQIGALRSELSRLKMENQILKKAVLREMYCDSSRHPAPHAHVQATAMKEDSSAVVIEVSQSTSVCFDQLDRAIEALGTGVGDSVDSVA